MTPKWTARLKGGRPVEITQEDPDRQSDKSSPNKNPLDQKYSIQMYF